MYVHAVHAVHIVFIVPAPHYVNVTATDIQKVGQSLMLQCSVTTARGITSRVDIVWSSNGSELKRIEGANITSTSETFAVYTTFYSILQLSTSDDSRVFHCEGFVNVTPSVMATSSLTLNVTGKFLVPFYHYFYYICLLQFLNQLLLYCQLVLYKELWLGILRISTV